MIVKLMLSGQATDGWLPSEYDLKGYIASLRKAAGNGHLPLAAKQLRLLELLHAVWPDLPEPHQRRTALRLVANGWAGTSSDLLTVVRALAA